MVFFHLIPIYAIRISPFDEFMMNLDMRRSTYQATGARIMPVFLGRSEHFAFSARRMIRVKHINGQRFMDFVLALNFVASHGCLPPCKSAQMAAMPLVTPTTHLITVGAPLIVS